MIIPVASRGGFACTNASASDGDVGSTVDILSTGVRGRVPIVVCALSADAGTAFSAAYNIQRTGVAAGRIAVLVFSFVRGIIILIVRDGQRAGAFSIGLFQTGVATGAGQRVVPVQLNVGVAIALHGQRSLGIAVSCALPVDKHILQGHIGGVALLFGGNGDGVGSGLGLAGGLVFGDQDDFGIRTMVDVVAILILHKGAFVLIRPLGDGLATIFGHDLHTAFCYIVFCCKRRCGDGRDHGHQSRCGQHPQGKLFFHIFPHCKTLQTKKLAET